jgi:hypothetical protein
MDEITKFISHVSQVATFYVRKITFFCSVTLLPIDAWKKRKTVPQWFGFLDPNVPIAFLSMLDHSMKHDQRSIVNLEDNGSPNFERISF